MRNKEAIQILKFISDKRVTRVKALWKREQEKSNLFEKKYIEERNKRIYLESVVFTDEEKEYVLSLLLQDEVINSHSHSYEGGLYSKLNTNFLDFVSDIRGKIRKM